MQRQPDSIAIAGDLVHLDVQQQNWAAAQKEIADFSAAHPRDAGGPWLRATLAMARHQDDAAIGQLRQALQMQPGYLQAELDMGRIQQQDKNWDQAAYWYQQALRQQPKFVPLLTAVGNMYLEQRQWGQAEQYYRRALEAQPHFPLAAANLAWVEAEQNQNLTDALAWAQRAAQADPHEMSIEDTLGWVYYKLGSYQAALPVLQQCVQASPQTAMYHFHLGMTQLAAGQKPAGASQLRQALALHLPAPETEQARARLSAALP
jgi:tetratricopeptide (TPR) repeat protein